MVEGGDTQHELPPQKEEKYGKGIQEKVMVNTNLGPKLLYSIPGTRVQNSARRRPRFINPSFLLQVSYSKFLNPSFLIQIF